MINNRQSGRRRGRGGGNGQRQGGGQQGNGSRIDNRARGNANQLYEKYKNMAADAQRAGDRVNTEYYLQFADHYFRVLSEQRGRFDEQQGQQRRPRDDFDYDGDEEFGDEGEPIRAGEQAGDGPARAEQGEGRREFRRDREAGDGARREWRDRPERSERNERNDRPERNDRAERRNGEYRAEAVGGQHRAEPIAAGESLEGRAEEVLDADRPLDPPQPRRRGRLRAAEEMSEAADAAFEADRLPPALTVAANDAEPAEAKPRRRRPRAETPTAAE